MAKLIQKTSYIKPGKSAGGYAKYIATREKVQKLSGRGPATAAQQQLIQQFLHPVTLSNLAPHRYTYSAPKGTMMILTTPLS